MFEVRTDPPGATYNPDSKIQQLPTSLSHDCIIRCSAIGLHLHPFAAFIDFTCFTMVLSKKQHLHLGFFGKTGPLVLLKDCGVLLTTVVQYSLNDCHKKACKIRAVTWWSNLWPMWWTGSIIVISWEARVGCWLAGSNGLSNVCDSKKESVSLQVVDTMRAISKGQRSRYRNFHPSHYPPPWIFSTTLFSFN